MPGSEGVSVCFGRIGVTSVTWTLWWLYSDMRTTGFVNMVGFRPLQKQSNSVISSKWGKVFCILDWLTTNLHCLYFTCTANNMLITSKSVTYGQQQENAVSYFKPLLTAKCQVEDSSFVLVEKHDNLLPLYASFPYFLSWPFLLLIDRSFLLDN